MEKNNQNIVAFFTQLSGLAQYAFPFLSIIIPLIIWSTAENKLFVKKHAAEVFNFQLSILIYTVILGIASIPFLIYGFGTFLTFNDLLNGADIELQNYADAILTLTFGFLFLGILALAKAAEFFLIIYAAIVASRGGFFKYPLCIKFIKSSETNVLDVENLTAH